MTTDRHIFSHLNTFLLIGGIVGAFLFITLLPRIHPDAASKDLVSREEAIERAIEFVESKEFGSDSYLWTAHLRREHRILDTLSRLYTSQEIHQQLESGSLEQLPVYYWLVEGESDLPQDEEAYNTLRVRLSSQGEPWGFYHSDPSGPSGDRDAIAYMMRQIPDSLRKRLPATPDSLLQASPVFMLRPPGLSRGNPPPPPLNSPDNRPGFALSRTDAISLASFHLENTLFSQYDLVIDSVYRPVGVQIDMARVEVSGMIDSPAMEFNADLDLHASGVLASMNATFAPEDESSEANESDSSLSFDFSFNSLPAYLKIISYIVLVVLSLILFVRRLSAHLIDVKSAIQDAIWGALFIGGLVANQAGWDMIQDSESIWTGLLFGGLITLISASIAAFFFFMLSCGTDSISRFIWPDKLATLSMSRNLQFRNIPMGRAIIHGVCIAGILLGIQTLYLFLPGISIEYTETLDTFLSEKAFSPIAMVISENGGFTMLYAMFVLLGVGALVYVRGKKMALCLSAITLTFMLLQLGPIDLEPSFLQWPISACIGFVLAVSFHRFDYLTSFMALFVFASTWELAPGWLLPASGFTADIWIGLGLLAGCVLVGFIGLYSGKDASDADRFVPTYLKEIAKQERLKSELDIATQVQASLLPHTMPVMPGLDLAAMCLPAQEVGGDYFDFIRLDDDRMAMIIGDVSGKGIQAAFYMTLTKGFIRAICRDEASPSRLLTRVNQLFCENAPRGTFISLIYGIFDTAKDTFTFARAGHDPVVFRAMDDSLALLTPPGIAIGLTPTQTFETNIKDEIVSLSIGDLLIFYTDGVTEAVNSRKEQFGSDRLIDMVQNVDSLRASMVLQNLAQRVQMFVQATARHDDMTLIVARWSEKHIEIEPQSNPPTQSTHESYG